MPERPDSVVRKTLPIPGKRGARSVVGARIPIDGLAKRQKGGRRDSTRLTRMKSEIRCNRFAPTPVHRLNGQPARLDGDPKSCNSST